jgi:hypothetical protein
MDHAQLTAEAKARLFDTLMKHGPLLVEAVYRLAQVKAEAAAAAVSSGLRIGGHAFTPNDFGLGDLSAAYEVLTSEPLDVAAMVDQVKAALPAQQFACHIDVDDGGVPDKCVLDGGNPGACLHSKRHGSAARAHCGAWRPVMGPASLVPSAEDPAAVAAVA